MVMGLEFFDFFGFETGVFDDEFDVEAVRFHECRIIVRGLLLADLSALLLADLSALLLADLSFFFARDPSMRLLCSIR
jgi:hypothetical protein